jgi:hypothetical protein
MSYGYGEGPPQQTPVTGHYQPPAPRQPQEPTAGVHYPPAPQPPGHRRASKDRERRVIRTVIGGFILLAIGTAIGAATGKTPASRVADTTPAATVTVTVTAHAKALAPPASAHLARRQHHHHHHLAVRPVVSASSAPAPSASAPPPSASAPAPSPKGSPGPASCHPLTNSGHCYEPGEYCRSSDHGVKGIAGDGERIVCEDNDGWRWEPY